MIGDMIGIARRLCTEHRSAAGRTVIAGFLCFFLAMGLWFTAGNSQTFDEPLYYYSGYAHLSQGDFSVNRAHPPLSKQIAALPLYLLSRLHVIAPPRFAALAGNPTAAPDFLYRSPLSFSTLLFLGRVPMLFLGFLTILLIARWSYRIWGMPAAILGSGLAVTEPTLIAHSSLITPDIATTFFVVLLSYLLWEYTQSASLPRFLLAGIALGAALGSKFSAIIALAALIAIAAMDAPSGGWVLPWRHRLPAKDRWHPYAEMPLMLSYLCAIALLTLLFLYAFHGLSLWRDGLVDQLTHVSGGHPAFFLGRHSTTGWWYYFPVAFALKTPVLTLAAIVASLVLCRAGLPLRRREALFLLVLPALWLLTMMWGGVDVGIRYLLPMYPFLFLVASRLSTFSFRPRLLMPAILLTTIAWNAVGTLALAPHFLASASVIAGGPSGLARFLSDSNVDWGQDLAGLKRYMDRERIPSLYLSYFGTARPSDYGIRYQAIPPVFVHDARRERRPPSAPDILAISVTNLHGVYVTDHDLYAWLRESRPVTTIGYSIHVYDLSGIPGAHCRLADIYAATGEREYQRIERTKCE